MMVNLDTGFGEVWSVGEGLAPTPSAASPSEPARPQGSQIEDLRWVRRARAFLYNRWDFARASQQHTLEAHIEIVDSIR